jgi:hypothetical protein
MKNAKFNGSHRLMVVRVISSMIVVLESYFWPSIRLKDNY